MRRGAPFLPRLGMFAAALSLAILVSVVTATALHSDPGDHRSAEEAAFAEPMAVAKGFQRPPNIRPEPAVPPELRNLKPEPPKVTPPPAPEPPSASEKAKQQKAERQKAERQRAERRRAERQKAERQRAERRKAKAEREKAEQSSAARRVLPLPAERAGGARAEKARPAPRGGKMALSINSIGLRNSPIKTTDEQRALDNGLVHLPQTSRPWERGKARNVYVVGHRMGWPGTKSWKIFYRLDELQRGDRLVLTAGGKTYRYKVSEKLVVTPWDVWVTEPVKGRDLLTLQTCTGPNFGKRLIVRADRV